MRASRRGMTSSTLSAEMFATATSGRRQRFAQDVDEPGLDLDAVRLGIAQRRLERRRVVVDCEHRREAEAGRGDREHARAAADVEQAPPLEPVQQLEAEPRGRVPPGAERATGIDHDRLDPLGRRLPGRPDPELPHADRPVEVPPALIPVGGHVVGTHLAEGGPEPLLPRVVGVRDELEPVGVLDLLEALREELEHQRARRLGALDRNGRGDAAERQRNALFSFWKNPSSAS